MECEFLYFFTQHILIVPNWNVSFNRYKIVAIIIKLKEKTRWIKKEFMKFHTVSLNQN